MLYKYIKFNEGGNAYFLERHAPEIPMWKSRIWWPILDFPSDFIQPEWMSFAAMINLLDISEYDNENLLPHVGFLYFFVWDDWESGKVIYSESNVLDLQRLVKEHDGWYFEWMIISWFESWNELLEDRYEIIDGEKQWDEFIWSELTKIWWISTNSQKEESEIIDKSNSEDFLLLQVWENITWEWVQSVFINKDDLKNKNFDNCIFEWSQT